MTTPAQIEKRLIDLSKELDQAHSDLVESENKYHSSKANFEVAMAKSRMRNSQVDMKMTATMREDQALIENEELHNSLAMAEAMVKASRANAARLRTQVDITRSVSSSIKSSMDL